MCEGFGGDVRRGKEARSMTRKGKTMDTSDSRNAARVR